MISEFKGNDEKTHEAYQSWRRTHVDSFNMSEGAGGVFTIHWTQDKRENPLGRGCQHQGISSIAYKEDKDSCYTRARKVCAESLAELIAWARQQHYQTKNCQHCDTRAFPFPNADLPAAKS